MKRNRVLLFGLFTFALVCASLTFVGSTYAKYTSKVTGSDTVQAAKYAWTVNGESEHKGSIAFDFSNEKLAPGDTVTATVEVENNSEVALIFTMEHLFDFSLVTDAYGSATNPVLYSLSIAVNDNASAGNWYNDNPSEASSSTGGYTANVAEIETKTAVADTSFTLRQGSSATITLTLQWPEGNADLNNNDTIIGRNGAKWTVELDILAVQKIGSTTDEA